MARFSLSRTWNFWRVELSSCAIVIRHCWRNLKFGEQNFRVLGEMRGKFWYIDPKIWKFWDEMGWKCRHRLWNFDFSKIGSNSGKWEIGTSKLEIRFRFSILGDRNSKSIPKIQNFGFKKWEIGTSKSEIRFWFWIFGPGNWFWKFESRFLSFLSHFDLGPQNLKSATSKNPKSWFSLLNSYFRLKFFFDQNLDFVLGTMLSWPALPNSRKSCKKNS